MSPRSIWSWTAVVMILSVVRLPVAIGAQARVPDVLAPDLVLVSGNVITVDRDFSLAEAVAVKDGRILAVGRNSDILGLLGTQTRVLDLKGKTILPGINDAHLHLVAFGAKTLPLSLDVSPRKVKSVGDVIRLVGERAKIAKPGEWIRGSGLNLRALDEYAKDPQHYPTRAELDAVAPNNPVYLGPFEAFAEPVSWVNSKALQLANIDKDTKPAGDGPAEEIVRDPGTGEPLGIIRGAASQQLVTRVIPAWTNEQLKQGILGAIRDLNALGITSATEGALSADMLRLYTELHDDGKLNLRVTVLQAFSPRSVNDLQKLHDGMAVVGTSRGFGDSFLRMGGVKFGIDNIPNNKSGWFYEEYAGGGNGSVTWPGKDTAERVANMKAMVAYAHEHGFQVGMHTTGDRAADTVIDSFIQAERAEPRRLRHYIIHGDFTPVGNARRMADSGIGMSVQPALGAVIVDLMKVNVGERRMQKFLPLRSMIEGGVHVAGGSDGPVIYPDWKQGVQFAVTRETVPTGRILNPEERLSIQQAIRMFTIEAAWQDHAENEKGSIEAGKLADFCILDQDILTTDPHRIKDIRTVMTIVGGRIVYDATADREQTK